MREPPRTDVADEINRRLAERCGFVTTVLECAPGSFPVAHLATARCAIELPHEAATCGEFDPPRPGFGPDADRPLSGRPLRTWLAADWLGVFRRIEQHARVAARQAAGAPSGLPPARLDDPYLSPSARGSGPLRGRRHRL